MNLLTQSEFPPRYEDVMLLAPIPHRPLRLPKNEKLAHMTWHKVPQPHESSRHYHLLPFIALPVLQGMYWEETLLLTL